MADFSALKTSIQNYIKQNGNEEITGNLLQQVLLSMVTTLGDSAINDLVTALNNEVTARQNADGTLQGNINTLQGVVNGIKANIDNGYVYAGIANPSTTPASGKVFYLALTAGTYTNFGATVVPQGINILKYNGSAWSLDSFLGLDNAPTQGSNNLVKSGGVLDSIIKDGSAFDLSAYNSGTTYADLSAALTALNALPAAYKKGGMSMKFVHTSDNKYVQYSFPLFTFTDAQFSNVANWQAVKFALKIYTSTTDNFLDVTNVITAYRINNSGQFVDNNYGGVISQFIYVGDAYSLKISGYTAADNRGVVFLSEAVYDNSKVIDGYKPFGNGAESGFLVPEGANFVVVNLKYNSTYSDDYANLKLSKSTTAATQSYSPKFLFNGDEVDLYNSIKKNTGDVAILKKETQVKLYTCSTAESSNKIVDGYATTDYTYIDGGAFKIKFTNKNTKVAPVTLQMNNLTGKKLYYNNAPVSDTNTWKAGEIVDVYYDSSAESGAGAFFARSIVSDKVPVENSQYGIESGGVWNEAANIKGFVDKCELELGNVTAAGKGINVKRARTAYPLNGPVHIKLNTGYLIKSAIINVGGTKSTENIDGDSYEYDGTGTLMISIYKSDSSDMTSADLPNIINYCKSNLQLQIDKLKSESATTQMLGYKDEYPLEHGIFNITTGEKGGVVSNRLRTSIMLKAPFHIKCKENVYINQVLFYNKVTEQYTGTYNILDQDTGKALDYNGNYGVMLAFRNVANTDISEDDVFDEFYSGLYTDIQDAVEEVKVGYRAYEDNHVSNKYIPYTIKDTLDSYSETKRINILFFTDSHIDTDPANFQNVKDTIDYANTCGVSFDAIIHGGDVMTQSGIVTKTDAKAIMKPFFDEMKKSQFPVMFTIGNHDTNNFLNTPANTFDDDDWSDMWFDYAETKYGIVRQTRTSTKKSTWSYLDIPTKKVRIITLNAEDTDMSITRADGTVLYYNSPAFYISNEQFNWLVNTALDFDDKTDKDWGVIVVLHNGNPTSGYGIYVTADNWVSGTSYVIGSLAKYNNVVYRCIEANSDVSFTVSKWKEVNAEGDITKMFRALEAFNSQSTYSESYTFSGDSFYDLNVSADWTRYANLDKKPSVMCVLVGHEHVDKNEVSNGVNVIWTGRNAYNAVGSKNIARVKNTVTQNLFDLFSIDNTTRKIRIIRYGAGVNANGSGGDRFLPNGQSY